MKKKLEQLKRKLNRKGDEGVAEAPADALADTPVDNDIDAERASILERGKNYIKPMSLNPQKALKITGIIIGVLLVGIVLLFALLIYRFKSDSDLVYGASRIIPYPAACVDGSAQLLPYPALCAGGSYVTYREYLFELRSLKSYSSNPIGGGEGIDFTTEEGQAQLETLRTLAMAEAQRKVVVEELAREREVSVSKEELDETIQQYIENEGGEEQLEEAIESFYGWNLSDFRSVIHVQLLQQKLAEQEAEVVLARVEAGEDFAELAREFSSDGSASEGGDLGFVTDETQFVPEFLDAALALEPGEVSGLVESQYGYHIIKATERDEEEGLRVSHILIDPSSVQGEIQRRLDEVEVRNYIGVSSEPQQPETTEPPQEEGTEE